MAMMVKMEVKPEEIKVFLEDLLASTSPEYLESIKEPRKDYKEGRVKTHKEAFAFVSHHP